MFGMSFPRLNCRDASLLTPSCGLMVISPLSLFFLCLVVLNCPTANSEFKLHVRQGFYQLSCLADPACSPARSRCVNTRLQLLATGSSL